VDVHAAPGRLAPRDAGVVHLPGPDLVDRLRRAVGKVRNGKADPRVAFALEDAAAPVVAEGRAQLRGDFPDEVVAAFAAKYDGWDVRLTYGSSGGLTLFEVPVDRWLLAGIAQ
jgi:hypothetical protein